MENLVLGLKSFVLGITTFISAATSPAITAPVAPAHPSPTPESVQIGIILPDAHVLKKMVRLLWDSKYV